MLLLCLVIKFMNVRTRDHPSGGPPVRPVWGPTWVLYPLLPHLPDPSRSTPRRLEQLRCLTIVADLDGDETRRQDGETDSKTVQRSPDQLQTSAYEARLRLYREAPSFP